MSLCPSFRIWSTWSWMCFGIKEKSLNFLNTVPNWNICVLEGYFLMCLLNFFYPFMINNNSNSEFCLSSKQKFAFCLWVEPKVVPGCIRTKLTTLKYLLVKETMSYDMEVLKYLLGNAEVLKTVTIAFEQSLNLEEEMRLYAELLKFPRASMGCAIKRDSSWFALLKWTSYLFYYPFVWYVPWHVIRLEFLDFFKVYLYIFMCIGSQLPQILYYYIYNLFGCRRSFLSCMLLDFLFFVLYYAEWYLVLGLVRILICMMEFKVQLNGTKFSIIRICIPAVVGVRCFLLLWPVRLFTN